MEAKLQHNGWEQPPEFPQLCRYLAERSPQPMVAVEGLTHIVRYVNPAFRKLVGKENHHLLGLPFGKAVPEGMANGCPPLLDRVFSTGTPEALAEQEHRSGAAKEPGITVPIYWSYLVWAILGPAVGDEKPVGVMIQVTVSTEIAKFRSGAAAMNEALLMSSVRQHELTGEAEKLTAELRASEAHEREAKQEAEAANRSKDMFLATLSHEMRTPLNAISAWMGILRQDGCNNEDLQEGLEVIDRNTRVQVQLIDDVLDVARIISRKLRLEIMRTDLAEIVEAGVDVVRAAAKAKNITLNLQLSDAGNRIDCDAVRMQQVVWNLVSNAVKFTPAGGKVAIRISRDKSAVKIHVTDTGQGMSADLLPFVFDRFRQADSSTRRRFGGLGLGLSIVKQLVEMHGGTVEAHSPGEGKGSTFTVILPVHERSSDELETAGAPAGKPAVHLEPDHPAACGLPLVRLDGLRLLIVDDEADVRRVLTKVLGEAGATVTAASSAAEAMTSLKAWQSDISPHVLVSDIGMPDEDGLDLIRQVRKAGHTARDLPAVALTAFVHKEDQRQALLAGYQVHVPKPVDLHDLTMIIASLAGMTGT